VKLSKYLKGQSLFELIVAILITAITLVAIISLVSSSINNSTYSRDRTEASRYSLEAMEWLRSERDIDWNLLVSRGSVSGRTFCLQNLDWTISGNCTIDTIPNSKFSREIELVYDSVADPNSIEARVITYWQDTSGYHESRLSTFLTNWRTN